MQSVINRCCELPFNTECERALVQSDQDGHADAGAGRQTAACPGLYGAYGTWNDVTCSEAHYYVVECDGLVPVEGAAWGAVKAIL
jgi:hypothetical protein